MSNNHLITTQTTQKMASLSRIQSNPSDDFLEINTQNLNGILDYIKEIQSVDTGNISPTDIIQTITVDKLREDEPESNMDKYQSKRQRIIDNFPKKQGNLLVIPNRVV